jgi:hypothetical protein
MQLKIIAVFGSQSLFTSRVQFPMSEDDDSLVFSLN